MRESGGSTRKRDFEALREAGFQITYVRRLGGYVIENSLDPYSETEYDYIYDMINST